MLPITKKHFKYPLITLLKLIFTIIVTLYYEHFVIPLTFSSFISNKALKKICKCVRSSIMINPP